MNRKEAKGYIRKAARIITDKGMCRYQLGFEDGPVCAIGALNMATHGSPRFESWRLGIVNATSVESAIWEHTDGYDVDLIEFNNQVAEDEFDVASLLMGLAEEL